MASVATAYTTTEGASQERYVYNTQRQRRGKALVFNIREFQLKGQPTIPSRKFTDVDLSQIITPLKNLGFEVDIIMHDPGLPRERKVSYETVISKINEVSKEDHTNADCFLCLFLSYGYHGHVFTSDWIVPIEKLQRPLTAEQCPSLAGKPKLFILQTCFYQTEKTTVDSQPIAQTQATIPNEADFLVFWSHIQNTKYPFVYKYGTGSKGTIFIQLLARHLRDHLKLVEKEGKISTDFVQFCVRVTGAVRQHLEDHYPYSLKDQLLPVTVSMLTNELYIGPKEN